MLTREKSIIEELAEYIKKNLKKGYTIESLKWALINQGYMKIQVEKAIKKAQMDLAAEAPLLKTKPKIEYKAEPIIETKQENNKSILEKIKKIFSN